jgi:hypothetical protein
MVINTCFLDDIHSILDNSCMCLNEVILILNGTFLDQDPLNQRTYHADNFVLAPVVVVITH